MKPRPGPKNDIEGWGGLTSIGVNGHIKPAGPGDGRLEEESGICKEYAI